MWRRLQHSLKFATKSIARAPGSATLAILVLAIGIGTSTITFTAVDELLLAPNPLPDTFEDPSELVAVFTQLGVEGGVTQLIPMEAFERLRATSIFMKMFAYRIRRAIIVAADEPARVLAGEVTPGFMKTLGLQPAVGRDLDSLPSTDSTAIPALLSHSVWQRRGADPDVVGSMQLINGVAVTIVGIAPPDLRRTVLFGGVSVWVPLSAGSVLFAEEQNDQVYIVGRLPESIQLRQAQTGISQVQLTTDASPSAVLQRRWILKSLRETQLPTRLAPQVGVLFVGTALLVLLVAWANTSGILLGRWSTQRRQAVIRRALGAARWEVISEFLAEALIVALAAGLIGTMVALVIRQLFFAYGPLGTAAALLFPLSIDLRASLFVAAVSAMSILGVGLTPSLLASAASGRCALSEQGNQGMTAGRWSLRLNRFLLVTQVGVSVGLLALTGVFLRSESAALQADPGFELGRLVTVEVDSGSQGYTDSEVDVYHRQIKDRLEALPQIAGAAFSTKVPLGSSGARHLDVLATGEEQRVLEGIVVNYVDPGYFAVMGIPFFRGRDFVAAERNESPVVAIVNRALAARLNIGRPVSGEALRLAARPGRELTIVGVVENATQFRIGETQVPVLYLPRSEEGRAAVLNVSTNSNASETIKVIRDIVQSVDSTLFIDKVSTVESDLVATLLPYRIGAFAMGSLALLALFLASLGLYGISRFILGEEAGQMAIRFALGATPLQLIRFAFWRILRPVVIGITFGIVLAFFLSQVARGVLYGVDRLDIYGTASAAAVAMASSLLAGIGPVQQVLRVDKVRFLLNSL